MKPEISRTVKIEIPISAFSVLKETPEEFAMSMRIAAAVLWYEQGKISQAKASEIAGLCREDFIMALKEFNVSPFQYSAKEILQEAGYDET